MSDLRESGAEVLPLDITDIDSRQLLVRQINQHLEHLMPYQQRRIWRSGPCRNHVNTNGSEPI